MWLAIIGALLIVLACIGAAEWLRLGLCELDKAEESETKHPRFIECDKVDVLTRYMHADCGMVVAVYVGHHDRKGRPLLISRRWRIAKPDGSMVQPTAGSRDQPWCCQCGCYVQLTSRSLVRQ
jgi:hypothetical protein